MIVFKAFVLDIGPSHHKQMEYSSVSHIILSAHSGYFHFHGHNTGVRISRPVFILASIYIKCSHESKCFVIVNTRSCLLIRIIWDVNNRCNNLSYLFLIWFIDIIIISSSSSSSSSSGGCSSSGSDGCSSSSSSSNSSSSSSNNNNSSCSSSNVHDSS